jgi:hypothetical protein
MRTVLKESRDPQRIIYVQRGKNQDTLERYNLSVQGIYKRLARLGPEQYWKGPEKDDDGSDGSLWFFFHDEFGARFYVKLKLFEVDGEDWLKILSFHD